MWDKYYISNIKWKRRHPFWKYTECCSGRDAVGCRCRSSHKGTSSNRLGGADAERQRLNIQQKRGRENVEKKLHLLWKSKSTLLNHWSRCEYYKAFISFSFIVFPPISGELLPSSGHCLNSSLRYTRCVATMAWDFASKLQWKLQPGWCKHKGCFLENNSRS